MIGHEVSCIGFPGQFRNFVDQIHFMSIQFRRFGSSDIGSCQSLWFNKKIRSKSKQYFYYDDWYGKNVYTISDLLNPPLPGFKLFEELILDFDISNKDRRKYNFLIKNIPNFYLYRIFLLL